MYFFRLTRTLQAVIRNLLGFLKLPISLSYDLALLAKTWFDLSRKKNLTKTSLGWLDGQCVQGAGTYSPLDANQRLLGISASRG